MCDGKVPRPLLGSRVRHRGHDAKVGKVGVAALEQGRPNADSAGFLRDTHLEKSRTRGALVLDLRRRPADELAGFFGDPIATVGVPRLRGSGVSEPPLRSNAVRPDSVQQIGRRSEILGPALAHHDRRA